MSRATLPLFHSERPELGDEISKLFGDGLCHKELRGGWGTCQHDAGHKGRCSSVVFRCDCCGKTRRGTPTAWSRDGEYVRGIAICFMCARGLA
jgi:hypothetical protein